MQLAVDLLKSMLTFDASNRITVDEALRHPFLAPLFNEEEVVLAGSSSKRAFNADTEADLEDSTVLLRNMLREVLEFQEE